MKKQIVLLLLSGLLFGWGQIQDEGRNQPNIVYILADDLGYGETGAYGQQKIETPNIDALVESGMLFTQHYSGSPVCAPSRYMLMAGVHPGHAYIRGNDGMASRGAIWNYEAMQKNPGLEGQRPIPDSTITIAEVLKQVGYRTGAVGKWGLGGPDTEGHPNRQGFDFFYGYLCQRQAHTYYPDHLWKNEERVFLDNELVNPHSGLPDSLDPYDPASYARFQDQPDYAPALMLEEMLEFIEDNQDDPFFLYYATPIPHVSLQAPRQWVDYYVKKFNRLPDGSYAETSYDEKPHLGRKGLGYAPVRYPRATYAAMISYLDEQVGKLVDKLKETGKYENTLIMFTSDNGPTYNGGTDAPFFNSAGPFRETYGWGKGFIHEGGIRVPMIASWKGKITPGSTTDHLSAFWDILTTLSEVAGANTPENMDGISFVPLLTGNESQQKQHAYLYWEFPAYGGQQAVRMGKWKGIRKHIKKDGNLEIELYNLEADIREEHDVAHQYPDVVGQIKQIMEQEHAPPEVDAFKMKALGN